MSKMEEPTELGTVVIDNDWHMWVLADRNTEDCNWHMIGSGGAAWSNWVSIYKPTILHEGHKHDE